MSKTFFTADLHLDHGNILKYCNRVSLMTDVDREQYINLKDEQIRYWRPSRDSIKLMNRSLIQNINDKVGEYDNLWIQGDFMMKPRRQDKISLDQYYTRASVFRSSINCRNVFLIYGNHDHWCIRDLFNCAYDLEQLTIKGIRLTLSHYPLMSWNGSHHCSMERPNVLFYGHVHSQNEVAKNPLKYPESWCGWDVGVDGNNYVPYSLDEVMEKLEPRIKAFERYKRETTSRDPYREI